MENFNEIDKNNSNNKYEITIKSGSKNKSINHYVKKICKKIIEQKSFIELNAHGKFLYLKRIII